jgi:regulator of cell morphogenesis and NO signaling
MGDTTQIPSISPQATVGSLVAERPARATVFSQYGIDYCCGGKRVLDEVCREKNIPLAHIMAKLADIDAQPSDGQEDWTKQSLQSLIGHIVTCYHEPLRKEMPEILRLAEKVAKVHGDTHPEMVTVAEIFRRFKDELEQHMQKEEMVLFPVIARMEEEQAPQVFGCGSGIAHPLAVMTAEHEDAGAALYKMRELTNGYKPPQDACNSFRVLLFSLEKIESDMHQHVHKENNILFPRALSLSNAATADKTGSI